MISTVNSHTVIKTLSSLDGYDVPQFRKFSTEEVAWYATDDDRALGVAIRVPSMRMMRMAARCCDWLKGQVVAIKTAVLSFDAACLGQIMPPTGETVHKRVARDNVLSLPPPPAAQHTP